MAKKVKVKYSKTTTFEVDPELWDICEKVYTLILEQDAVEGISAKDKCVKWYAEVYKGGVGIKEAEAIYKKSSLFYLGTIEPGYEYIMEELDKKGAGKRPKKKDGAKRQADYSPDFIYKMCEHYVLTCIKKKPKGAWAIYEKALKKKYPDKARVRARLVERGHNVAYAFRVLLKVLEDERKLPKAAFS